MRFQSIGWSSAREIGAAAAIVAVGLSWRLMTGSLEAEATPAGQPASSVAAAKPVAFVNGVEITSDRLGEECLGRHGPTVLEALVNHRIIEQACQQQGVTVTPQDVAGEIEAMAKRFSVPRDKWIEMIQQERGITPKQYSDDIVWPMIALRRLARGTVEPTADELREAFEKQFGPAVKARIIVSRSRQDAEQVRAQAVAAPDEFGGLAIESIPPTMFAKAEGIAIFPDMIKGGFILGVNYGKGVLLVRRPDRSWSPPVMVTMGGGSLGFQAGVQSADIVLMFATPRSLNGILNGQKVTLGADASVALGPIGRQANAGTDARLGAEIYSYARSRGLFLGVSINGADLSVDNNANSMLYGRFGVTPTDVFAARGLAFHEEVKLLIDDLNTRSQATVQPATQLVPPPLAVPQPMPPPVQPAQAVQPVQAVGGFPTLPQPTAPPQPAVPITGATDTPYAPQPVAPPLVPIR